MLKKPKNTLRDEAQQKLRRRLYVIFFWIAVLRIGSCADGGLHVLDSVMDSPDGPATRGRPVGIAPAPDKPPVSSSCV